MTLFTIFMIIAIIFFVAVLLIRLNEKRYKLKKSEAVERFITYKNIDVAHLYVGPHFDLIHDENKEMIWYCAFQKQKLQYKEIPYENIYQVVWHIDGTAIRSTTKKIPSKEELITNQQVAIDEIENKTVNAQYRVKASSLTITLDETTRQTLELPLFSSNLPKSFDEVENSEVAVWYDLLALIIKKEETKIASSYPK